METALWDPISEPAKDLIQRMLTTDVNHRITIQEVLNHKWLRVSETVCTDSRKPSIRYSYLRTTEHAGEIPRFDPYNNSRGRSVTISILRHAAQLLIGIIDVAASVSSPVIVHRVLFFHNYAAHIYIYIFYIYYISILYI